MLTVTREWISELKIQSPQRNDALFLNIKVRIRIDFALTKWSPSWHVWAVSKSGPRSAARLYSRCWSVKPGMQKKRTKKRWLFPAGIDDNVYVAHRSRAVLDSAPLPLVSFVMSLILSFTLWRGIVKDQLGAVRMLGKYPFSGAGGVRMKKFTSTKYFSAENQSQIFCIQEVYIIYIFRNSSIL